MPGAVIDQVKRLPGPAAALDLHLAAIWRTEVDARRASTRKMDSFGRARGQRRLLTADRATIPSTSIGVGLGDRTHDTLGIHQSAVSLQVAELPSHM